MFVAAARRRSPRLRSFSDLATTMPPMHKAAMAMALSSRAKAGLRASLPKRETMALKTVSNAAFTRSSLRATSLGRATMGHEFSTSSRCWRDR